MAEVVQTKNPSGSLFVKGQQREWLASAIETGTYSTCDQRCSRRPKNERTLVNPHLIITVDEAVAIRVRLDSMLANRPIVGWGA
ncbi:hypothetical protein RvY_03801 [Ramazzottius varieornatus]|uniref:Uncharacterized protein n=1 Tax=Ramazzottius varieornatus TaxID=947166 RepID=A0A1D1UYP2_RAMVA|nr:hypothetical protein RvY_03801 [Ramazzottius varieornatus]